MLAVVDPVDTYLARYPASPVVLDVLGTDEPEEIRAVAFEAEPEGVEIFHFEASVGAVYGVRRRDGSRVSVKVNKLFTDEAYFREVQRVQTALADGGFPAPRPVRLVGTTTVDEWRDEGVFRDAHEPEVRRAMARALRDFVERATATGIRPVRTFLRAEGALWPQPHNALFDFEATADGAEWIDEIARLARASQGGGREVVGHLDWAAKHVRFDDDLRPTAVYDWDSVAVDREPDVVGTAAASFTYTEEVPVDSKWPSPEEALAFVSDYEDARDVPFDEAERRAVHGAAVYLAAYGARCGWAYARSVDRPSLERFAGALL